MEVDSTPPTKTSAGADKLCNGSSNGDLSIEKSNSKVQNGTKVNGLCDEPMEIDKKSNGVSGDDIDDTPMEESNNDEESKDKKFENGDSRISEDTNDSAKEAGEISKEIEDTDTADDSVQILDSSNNQNISVSSDVENISSQTSKDESKSQEDVECVKNDNQEELETGKKDTDTEKDKQDMEEKENENDKSKKVGNDKEKEDDAGKTEEENSGKNEVEKTKNGKDDPGNKDKDKEDKGKDKDENKDKDKNKDKAVHAVDLTEDKPETSQSGSKSRISAVLKPPSPSTQMRPMAGLLFDLGMDLARQQVYKDLIRIQQKKQSMDKLDDKETRQLDKLKEAYDDLVAKNSPYTTGRTPDCDKCEFKGDLDTVIENHMEYGHVNEAGVIKCNFCEERFKVSQQFILHMEQKHKRKGRVVVRHSFFVCPYCPFEHNSKASFNKHILRCERVFNLLRNLEPTPADCDIPIKLPKPPAVPPQKHKSNAAQAAAAAAVAAVQRNKHLGRPAQKTSASASQPVRMTHQQAAAATIRPPVVVGAGVPPGSQVVQVGNQWYHMVNLNGQRFLTPVPPGTAIPSSSVQQTTGVMQLPRQQSPATSKNTTPASAAASRNKTQHGKNNKDKGTFEICEICGGFVKDRDSLRIHFFWAHKVDIQKDVFASKNPNLTCDRCNFRCWTVAGMQRHKSMAHQDMAKSKDKARTPFYCTLCRPTPELLHTETFWLHMAAKHRIGPDSVFTQPQCVVCGVPNVGVARALETHMLNVHNHLFSVDLLQLARKLLAPATGLNPQPAQKHHHNSSNSMNKGNSPRRTVQMIACDNCDMTFNTMTELELHNNYEHSFKCSRCKARLSSREQLTKHFHDKHKDDKDPCALCGSLVSIGRPMVRHMRSNHLKDCSVVITRLPQSEVNKRMERYIQMFGQQGSIYRTPVKNRKRGRSSVTSEASVIVVEETPVKKSRTSATRKAVSEERRKAMKIKDVIEVDGEEVLVEVQQDEDDSDSVTVVTVESSQETKKASEAETAEVDNKKGEKEEKVDGDQTEAMDTEESSSKDDQEKEKNEANQD